MRKRDVDGGGEFDDDGGGCQSNRISNSLFTLLIIIKVTFLNSFNQRLYCKILLLFNVVEYELILIFFIITC